MKSFEWELGEDGLNVSLTIEEKSFLKSKKVTLLQTDCTAKPSRNWASILSNPPRFNKEGQQREIRLRLKVWHSANLKPGPQCTSLSSETQISATHQDTTAAKTLFRFSRTSEPFSRSQDEVIKVVRSES